MSFLDGYSAHFSATKVAKSPLLKQKWPRKNPVFSMVCGLFGQMPTFICY
nr:MAG TPA: hypothetical protein [Caudoviricetes sp.]